MGQLFVNARQRQVSRAARFAQWSIPRARALSSYLRTVGNEHYHEDLSRGPALTVLEALDGERIVTG
jgi:hypothetical protein